MATKYYCDRCKREIPFDGIDQVTLVKDERSYDLCESCLNRVKEALKQ